MQKSKRINPPKMSLEALERLSLIFKSLGDKNRLILLQELQNGEKSVNELVEITGFSQATTSKSLKLLYNEKILSKRKEGTKVYYCMSNSYVLKICKLLCDQIKENEQKQAEIEFFI